MTTAEILALYNPDSPEHDIAVARRIDKLRDASAPQADKQIKGLAIDDIPIWSIRYEQLNNSHFHFTDKNNGASIEANGLKSRIGKNSTSIDDVPAIYFSLGVKAILHNWDVWLRWRITQLYSPIAAQAAWSDQALTNEERGAIMRMASKWMADVASRKYLEDEKKIMRAFEYERVELSNSDYLLIDIEPFVDYDPNQDDPKKIALAVSSYAREIYGVGVSTDETSMRAERWNLSTPLGKDVTITPNRIHRLVISSEHNDALAILGYCYNAYIANCFHEKHAPAAFALLPAFLDYCGIA